MSSCHHLLHPHRELGLREPGDVQPLLTITIATKPETSLRRQVTVKSWSNVQDDLKYLTIVGHQAGADPGAVSAGVLLALGHRVGLRAGVESAYNDIDVNWSYSQDDIDINWSYSQEPRL